MEEIKEENHNDDNFGSEIQSEQNKSYGNSNQNQNNQNQKQKYVEKQNQRKLQKSQSSNQNQNVTSQSKSPNSGNNMDNKRDSKKRFSKLHKITEIISLQNPFDAQVQYYCKKYGFNEKELRAIKKSFDQIAEKGLMTMEQFKESLGLIGLNEDFVRKIWYVISGGGPESQASFEDFLKYLKVLMNGTQYEKALWSFNMLSSNKQYITEQDIMNVVYNISLLWNRMVGSLIYPTQEYIRYIFNLIDIDGDGIISFDDYYIVYKHQLEIFGWYEYLNQEETKIQKQKDEYNKQLKKRYSLHKRPSSKSENQIHNSESKIQNNHLLKKEFIKQFNENHINLKQDLDNMKSKLFDCLNYIKQEKEQVEENKQNYLKQKDKLQSKIQQIYVIKNDIDTTKFLTNSHKMTQINNATNNNISTSQNNYNYVNTTNPNIFNSINSKKGYSEKKIKNMNEFEPGDITPPLVYEVEQIDFTQLEAKQSEELKQSVKFKDSLVNFLKKAISDTYDLKQTCNNMLQGQLQVVKDHRKEIIEQKRKKNEEKMIIGKDQRKKVENLIKQNTLQASVKSQLIFQNDVALGTSQFFENPTNQVNGSINLFGPNQNQISNILEIANATLNQSQYGCNQQSQKGKISQNTQISNNEQNQSNSNNNIQQNNQSRNDHLPQFMIKGQNNNFNQISGQLSNQSVGKQSSQGLQSQQFTNSQLLNNQIVNSISQNIQQDSNRQDITNIDINQNSGSSGQNYNQNNKNNHNLKNQINPSQLTYQQLQQLQQFYQQQQFQSSNQSNSNNVSPRPFLMHANSSPLQNFSQFTQNMPIPQKQSQNQINSNQNNNNTNKYGIDYSRFNDIQEMDEDDKQQNSNKNNQNNQKNEQNSEEDNQELNNDLLVNPEGTRSNFCVYFGQENFQVVICMMIGIRTAIKRGFEFQDNWKLDPDKFTQTYQYDIAYKQIATKKKSKLQNCVFYDYSPVVFERIRNMYKITNDMYLKSIGPEQVLANLLMGNLSSLSEKCSTGKSNSFFYYSEDDQFMLKTIKEVEFKFFKKILRNYYNHLRDNPQSLISRIYGLHRMKIGEKGKNPKKLYFVIMGNIFQSGHLIDFRYDLKGSLYQRTSKVNDQYPEDIQVARKDLDWLSDKMVLNLSEENRQNMKKQIASDVQFFIDNGANDYSLLVGFHEIQENLSPKKRNTLDQDSSNLIKIKVTDNNNNEIDESQNKRKCDRFYEEYEGGMLTQDNKYIVFLGIIDIFTEYTFQKKMQYIFKKNFQGSDISCLPFDKYGNRFREFMYQYVLQPGVNGQISQSQSQLSINEENISNNNNSVSDIENQQDDPGLNQIQYQALVRDQKIESLKSLKKLYSWCIFIKFVGIIFGIVAFYEYFNNFTYQKEFEDQNNTLGLFIEKYKPENLEVGDIKSFIFQHQTFNISQIYNQNSILEAEDESNKQNYDYSSDNELGNNELQITHKHREQFYKDKTGEKQNQLNKKNESNTSNFIQNKQLLKQENFSENQGKISNHQKNEQLQAFPSNMNQTQNQNNIQNNNQDEDEDEKQKQKNNMQYTLSKKQITQQVFILIWLIVFDIFEFLFFVNCYQFSDYLLQQQDQEARRIIDDGYIYNKLDLHKLIVDQQKNCFYGKWMERIVFLSEVIAFCFIQQTQIMIVQPKGYEELLFTNKFVIFYIQYSMQFMELLIILGNLIQIIIVLYLIYFGLSVLGTHLYNKYKFYRIKKYLKGEKFTDFKKSYQNEVIARNQQFEMPDTCPICMEAYQNNDYVVNLKCRGNHHFHSNCAIPWINQNSSCPNCREQINENNFI